jgi:hypothetical protein
MNHEPRALAATESYPTFWDDLPKLPAAAPVAPEEAYSAFVNLTEDAFPGGEFPAVAETNAD